MATVTAPIPDDMETQTFARRVAGLQVDPRIAAAAMTRDAPADRCLLVFFTPRSGSTWLTGIVRATQRLGFLEEYINPAFVRDVATQMQATDQPTLLAMLQRWARTDNGVFSMELRAVDAELFGEEALFAGLGAAPAVFFLWRDDIVAQGISLFRAVTTQRYHSTDAPTPPPAYDAEQIASWTRHIADLENGNLLLLRRRFLRFHCLRYEDMVRDRAGTLLRLASVLGITLPRDQLSSAAAGDLEKIGDSWNEMAEQRFRREQADVIRALEAERLIRRAIDRQPGAMPSGRMRRQPMPGDIDPPCDPDTRDVHHVIEQPLQAHRPPGVANNAIVQAN